MAKTRIRVNQKIGKGIYRQTTMDESEGMIYALLSGLIEILTAIILLPLELLSGSSKKRRR